MSVTFDQLYDFARQTHHLDQDPDGDDSSLEILVGWARERGHHHILEEVKKRFPGLFEDDEDDLPISEMTNLAIHLLYLNHGDIKIFLREHEGTEIGPIFLRWTIDSGKWDRARFLFRMGAKTDLLTEEEKKKLDEE